MAINRKIKVGQDTISSLKSMGMKEAVRYANSLVGTKGNAEIIEGARRLYGSRVKADSAMPKYKSRDAARMGTTKKAVAPKKSGPVMVDGKGPNARKLTYPEKPSATGRARGYAMPTTPAKAAPTAAQKAKAAAAKKAAVEKAARQRSANRGYSNR